jgi:hypothetical protein
MRNVRKIMFAAVITAAVLACGLGGTPAVPADNVATIVASTIQALTPIAPAATATTAATAQPAAAQGIPVTYRNVSFTLPLGLAADAAPELVPAATENDGGPWDAAPEHIRFRLDNYSVPANSFSVTRIDIYPAEAYGNANAGANIGLQRLKGMLADPTATLTNQMLPQVPYFNAASMFAANIQRIRFQNGNGVRFVTQYGQAVGPIANNGVFYHFQGLTDDGKYYIIAVLPVELPFLENGNDPNAGVPAGGVPFPGYNYSDAKYFDDYFKAVTDKMNATDAGVFQPSLAKLDALMQSFAVQP